MLRADRVGYIDMKNSRSGAEPLGRLWTGFLEPGSTTLVSSRAGSLP